MAICVRIPHHCAKRYFYCLKDSLSEKRWYYIDVGIICSDCGSNNDVWNIDHLSNAIFCVNKYLEEKFVMDLKGYPDILNPKSIEKVLIFDSYFSLSAWNILCKIMTGFINHRSQFWGHVGGSI